MQGLQQVMVMNAGALNILHVEDDYADALLVQNMLDEEMRGGAPYHVRHVESLKQALAEINREKYSVVLLDLGLRDVDGLDNIRAIQEENPDIPIVVLTGHNCEKQALNAVRSGAQEYIVKGHGDGNVIRMAINSSVQRKHYERKLFQQANYDDLTGLPNRRHFMLHLKATMERAERWERDEVVMFMDLNKFKNINDTLGHEAGNVLLREFARRVKDALRNTDMFARYGGDEFVLHLDTDSTSSHENTLHVIRKIFVALAPPYNLDGVGVDLSASIGISVYPKNGMTADELLQKADAAMYLAKKKGPNSYAFSNYN